MNNILILSVCIAVLLLSCEPKKEQTEEAKPVKLVTVDPGHFHAALVQKSMYSQVDSIVHVYAPEGPDLQLHLNRIESYNSRQHEPTRWVEEVYTGGDFFEKMIAEKAGNVVVLSGNNRKKTEYISKSLEAGFNVLADKPMVIDKENFELLKRSFEIAKEKNLLLYDIMTERHEITTMLQKEFSLLPGVFGELENGSPDEPAITKESVHHLYKYVSGSVLTRPAWFLDVSQQGEGVVDVMTHLVDLVQWECFPEQIIDYENEVELLSARRWTTNMTLEEFKAITKMDAFPGYLQKDVVADSILKIYCNGEINYKIRGVHAKTSVIWAYKAPEGTGDTHYSIMRGTKANLVIRQGEAENYQPTLYIEPIARDEAYADALRENIETIRANYPGVDLSPSAKGWQVIIPDQYKVGHEAHFAQVTEKFLEYLEQGNMPKWEVPNMIAKYYITTQGLQMAKSAGE